MIKKRVWCSSLPGKMGASESSRLECACFQYTSGRLAFLFVFSTPASHADAGCLVSLWPKVTKSPAFPFQVLPSPPVPQTTQGFIGWRSAVPGLNKCLELDDEIRSCKGAFARELCWPKQGVHWIQAELLPRGGACRSPGTRAMPGKGRAPLNPEDTVPCVLAHGMLQRTQSVP